MAGAHTRPYICTFSFAGCTSRFGNKSEWKRHVNGHLCLQYWLCDRSTCGSKEGSLSGLKFNRKDLFTAHLRRMHGPVAVKSRKNAEWEKLVKNLLSSCLKIRRQLPTTTKCPVRACTQIFESWDDRMEHVGGHLEKASLSLQASSSRSSPDRDLIDQESEDMIAWGMKERIIEGKPEGGFSLCTSSWS